MKIMTLQNLIQSMRLNRFWMFALLLLLGRGLALAGPLNIQDLAGNAVGNLPYTGGETYIFDDSAPAISLGSPSVTLTRTGPVTFAVTYTDPNFASSTLSTSDITVNTTGTASASVSVSGSGATRTITLSGISGQGTLGVSIAAGTGSDTAGNLAAASGPSATFVVDNTPPVVDSGLDIACSLGAGFYPEGQAVDFTITFSENVLVSGTPQLALTIGGQPASAGYRSGSGSGTLTFRHTIPNGENGGFVVTSPIILISASIQDAAGNNADVTLPPTDFSTLIADTTLPIFSISPPSDSIVNTNAVHYTVTYTDTNPSASPITSGSISLNRTGTADATIELTGTGLTRTVTLDHITGNGTLGISMVAGEVTDAAGNIANDPGASTTVIVDNTLPSINSPLTANGVYDTLFTYTISATEPSTFFATDVPSGWTVNPLTGLISGTPTQPGLVQVGIYAIDAADNTNRAVLAITIEKATTSVAVAPSANPAVYGANVTFTATVSPSAASGTVVFKDGTVLLGPGTLAGGTASLTIGTLTAGNHSITAEYSSDDNYSGSSSPVLSQSISKATPSITAWPTAAGIVYNQALSSSVLSGGVASVPGNFAFTLPATTPVAGTASHGVTFTPTDADNYTTVIGSASVTVDRATPVVTTWPTAASITYGQTLAAATLSGAVVSPAGAFAFTTPATVPEAGTAVHGVTFTPTDSANYYSATGSASVTVDKANPVIATWPSATPITYGQTLADSTLSGGSPSVLGTFTFTTPTTAPSAGSALQAVTFTPNDTDNYIPASSSVSVTVNQATPTITTWPTAAGIIYNQTLADSLLSGGVASVPGGFAFTTPATAPVAGSAAQSVTFTPTDIDNYTTVTGSANVTVDKATPVITTWPTAASITYGQTLAAATLSGAVVSPAGTFAFTTPTTVPVAGTAAHSVTFTPTDGANYYSVTGSASVTVDQATPIVTTWPMASPIIYGQTLADAILSGGAPSVPGTFTFNTPATAPNVGSASHAVTFTPTDAANYLSLSGSANVTVDKATPVVAPWPAASPILYGQTLAASTLAGGSASVAGSFAFTTPATAPVAGTTAQGVTFTPTDTANYNTVAGSVSVTAGKATPVISAWPTPTALIYGQTLAESTLVGGSASVPGVFTFASPGIKQRVGVASQLVVFTPTDEANNESRSASINVTVIEATPVVTAWPTASAIAYGQTLAVSTLSGGVASVPGTFTFLIPSTTPTLGTAAHGVIFIATDSAQYNTVSGSVEVTVLKATPIVTSWPAASAITFGQSLADSSLSGGAASVPGSFAFSAPATLPEAGAALQSLTFTPTDTANYNPASGSVSVTVHKAASLVTTWPTASAITYGQTLADSILSEGAASVPGSFAFTTPATLPEAGTALQDVTFTPTDGTNYSTLTGTTSLTVDKATPTVTTWPTGSVIIYGQTLADSTLSGGAASVPGSFAYTTPASAPEAGTVSPDLTFTPTDNTNYNLVTATITLAVQQASTTVTVTSSANPSIYGGLVTFTATVTPTLASGTVLWRDGTNFLALATLTNGVATFQTPALSVGEHLVTATYSQDNNYAPSSSDPLTQVVTPMTLTVVKGPFLHEGQFTVRFAGTPGYTFTIEGTDTLGDAASWQKKVNLTAPQAQGEDSTSGFEFQDSIVGTPSRFYRAVFPAY
jgi:hypothetical protein